MSTESPEEDQPFEENASHWQVIRDVVAFQFKLLADSLRDLFLSPISIMAAVLGLITSRSDPGRYLYRLMEFGHRTDRWINLFGTYDEENEADYSSSDHFVRRAQEIVLSEYRKGGTLQEIKQRTDEVIDRLHAGQEKGQHSDSGDADFADAYPGNPDSGKRPKD